MSRCDNCYDNAMAENFFSILKTECIYRHKPASFIEANDMIDRYILFYNREQIQLKTGVPPLMLRHSVHLPFPTQGVFILSAQTGAVHHHCNGLLSTSKFSTTNPSHPLPRSLLHLPGGTPTAFTNTAIK